MFDSVRPVVLYCHRLQGVEKRVVVQAIHLIRVILQDNRFSIIKMGIFERIIYYKLWSRFLTLTRMVLSSM